METSWKKERTENVIVAQEPSIALNTLALFDTQVQRLKDRYNSLRKAIDALGLDTAADARLDPILAEVKGFKEVWSALGDVWNRVDTVKATLWGAYRVNIVHHWMEFLKQWMQCLVGSNNMKRFKIYTIK